MPHCLRQTKSFAVDAFSTNQKRVFIVTLLQGEVCNINREDNQEMVTVEQFVIDIEWDCQKGANQVN